MSVKVEIDHREHQLINLCKDELSLDISIVPLDAGDIRLSFNDTILIVIERKTISDLISSIKDGRYRDQKFRLIDNYEKSKIMYIIEGCIYGESSTDAVKGAIINTLIRDDIKVINLKDVKDTATFIRDIVLRVSKDPNKYIQGQGFQSTKDMVCHSKKSYVTKESYGLNAISQIPGVSKLTAQCLLNHYGSFHNFVMNGQIEEMSELKLPSGRRVGGKLAEKISSFISE